MDVPSSHFLALFEINGDDNSPQTYHIDSNKISSEEKNIEKFIESLLRKNQKDEMNHLAELKISNDMKENPLYIYWPYVKRSTLEDGGTLESTTMQEIVNKANRALSLKNFNDSDMTILSACLMIVSGGFLNIGTLFFYKSNQWFLSIPFSKTIDYIYSTDCYKNGNEYLIKNNSMEKIILGIVAFCQLKKESLDIQDNTKDRIVFACHSFYLATMASGNKIFDNSYVHTSIIFLRRVIEDLYKEEKNEYFEKTCKKIPELDEKSQSILKDMNNFGNNHRHTSVFHGYNNLLSAQRYDFYFVIEKILSFVLRRPQQYESILKSLNGKTKR